MSLLPVWPVAVAHRGACSGHVPSVILCNCAFLQFSFESMRHTTKKGKDTTFLLKPHQYWLTT